MLHSVIDVICMPQLMLRINITCPQKCPCFTWQDMALTLIHFLMNVTCSSYFYMHHDGGIFSSVQLEKLRMQQARTSTSESDSWRSHQRWSKPKGSTGNSLGPPGHWRPLGGRQPLKYSGENAVFSGSDGLLQSLEWPLAPMRACLSVVCSSKPVQLGISTEEV